MIVKVKEMIKLSIAYFFIIFTKTDKNKIVCSNFDGKGFGCNPKYIALELAKQGFEVVWLTNNLESDIPKNIRVVKKRSIKAIYELETAKVIVTNVTSGPRFIKRKKQILIQTWHGSYSPKESEKLIQNKLSKQYLKSTIENSEKADLFISNSRILTEEYKNNFWCKCKILESGFPRNDILVNITNKEILRIKQILGIEKTKKVILYTPTFRDDKSINGYKLNCDEILKNFSNSIILIRMHPNVTNYNQIFAFNNTSIIDVTYYDDVQELLAISDILITDFSSTMVDFSLMNKPVYIFANDFDEYIKKRNIRPMFFKLPFDICKTNDELIEKMKNFDEKKYIKKINQFRLKYAEFDDGKATNRVVNEIKKLIKKLK